MSMATGDVTWRLGYRKPWLHDWTAPFDDIVPGPGDARGWAFQKSHALLRALAERKGRRAVVTGVLNVDPCTKVPRDLKSGVCMVQRAARLLADGLPVMVTWPVQQELTRWLRHGGRERVFVLGEDQVANPRSQPGPAFPDGLPKVARGVKLEVPSEQWLLAAASVSGCAVEKLKLEVPSEQWHLVSMPEEDNEIVLRAEFSSPNRLEVPQTDPPCFTYALEAAVEVLWEHLYQREWKLTPEYHFRACSRDGCGRLFLAERARRGNESKQFCCDTCRGWYNADAKRSAQPEKYDRRRGPGKRWEPGPAPKGREWRPTPPGEGDSLFYLD